MDLLLLLVASLAGSVFSLAGGVLLLSKKIKMDAILLYAMPFGAGALLGAAFFDVLPEALHGAEHLGMEASDITVWVLIGFLVFFLLERGVRWFHRHHEHADTTSHKTLLVLGDTLHNAIDGVAIGAAFLVDPTAGFITALAVAAHELPQEIGDFGMLLGKGMAPKKVLLVNILSSLATVATAFATYLLGSSIEPIVPFLLAAVAGFFIYIAAADIIPDIHEQPHKRANIQSALVLVGIAIIPLVAWLIEAVAGVSHSH